MYIRIYLVHCECTVHTYFGAPCTTLPSITSHSGKMGGHVKLLLFLLQLPLVGSLSQEETWVDQDNCVSAFTELEKYIFSNETNNHERLESTFFPINDLSPSYVQVSYNHNCTLKSHRALQCSPEEPKMSPPDKTWLWASSPVYLVYHPEALNALAVTIDPTRGKNVKSVFTTNIGGDRVCVCLPPICPNSSASTDMLRNLTALVSCYYAHRHTHTHAHTHARIHAHIRTHTHTHTHMHTHTNTHTHMHTHAHTHAHTCTHTRTHTRTHAHAHKCTLQPLIISDCKIIRETIILTHELVRECGTNCDSLLIFVPDSSVYLTEQ